MVRYFHANNCEIIENKPGYLNVQLTIDLDKELMNRPFYWHYLEKTGGTPNPAKLAFITNKQHAPENAKGEAIYFGSPRLHQIFQSTKNLAGYIRLYENKSPMAGMNLPLIPWLGLNMKISYQCDRKRDVFKSIGLNLINGRLLDGFHDRLLQLPMTPKIPDYAYTLSPLIRPGSGVARVHSFLSSEISVEDHTWAEEARKRWKKDLDLLNHFYEGIDEKTESYETEKLALREQYEPKVNISIVNGGVFYITEKAI
nr:YqhG family protein [Bacillus sp. REN3]